MGRLCGRIEEGVEMKGVFSVEFHVWEGFRKNRTRKKKKKAKKKSKKKSKKGVEKKKMPLCCYTVTREKMYGKVPTLRRKGAVEKTKGKKEEKKGKKEEKEKEKEEKEEKEGRERKEKREIKERILFFGL